MFFKKKEKYDLIFSMGAACSCTQSLRRSGLQLVSFPLDWVVGGTFEKRVDFLINRFSDYLNKDDLVPQKPNAGAAPLQCDVYLNRRTGVVFHHDFLANISFEKSFQDVSIKYDRRIQRLHDTIEKSKDVLVVFMEMPNSDKKSVSEDGLRDALKKIREQFPNVNIDFLYCFSSEKDEKILIETPYGKIHVWEFFYKEPGVIPYISTQMDRELTARFCLKKIIYKRFECFISRKRKTFKKHFF